MRRSYERISVEQFGRQLITSGDLDPVYIALHRMDMGSSKLSRWLLAYWCLYHCGLACHLSEFQGEQFWDELEKAARNDTPSPVGGRWPRGSERRHWRGAQAITSCASLRSRYGAAPEGMVEYIASGPQGTLPFVTVAERAKEHAGFGPWISFKVADMLDRLGIRQVSFTGADVFMFKDPVLAAKMVYAQKAGMDPRRVREGLIKVKDDVIPEVVGYLENEFRDLMAPPLFERPIGLQEVETVLCCWKSHMNGHYPLYNDIMEINDGLSPWLPSNSTARDMYLAMPKEPGHVSRL